MHSPYFYFLPFEVFFTDFFFAAINYSLLHVWYISLLESTMASLVSFLENNNLFVVAI